MLKHCILAILLCIFLLPVVAQAPPAAASGSCSDPAAISAMANPVKPTAESLAQGKKYYGYDCAMCHGKDGDGKGEVDTGEKMIDFTNPSSLKDKTDGELFCALKTGKGHMPLENIRVTPNELWNLINYVHSLGK